MTSRRDERWRASLPRIDGTVTVVTGASSGVGLATAEALAGLGARVLLACRRSAHAAAAVARVEALATGRGGAELVELDLSDLGSVRAAAADIARRAPALGVLVNNAGVMALPRMLTVDGFERQLGVNHLGHFALTALLLPRLREGAVSGSARPGGRVVTMSSFLAAGARVRLDDLHGEASYDPWAAYTQSKLANLLFGLELGRRLAAAGDVTASLVVHPGCSRTALVANGPAAFSSPVERLVLGAGARLVGQSADRGAAPSLAAALDPEAANGDYWGPRGPGHLRGRPARLRVPRAGRDTATAAALWDGSEALTGTRFPW